jgi:hypothetical protein
MPLKLRPTGLRSGVDKDRPDYTVFTGEWAIGRIYQTRRGPDSLRWFWSMNANGPMTRSNRVATLRRPRCSFRRVGTSGRHGRSWRSCRRVGSAEVPFSANNCAPVAPRLLTLTDHPGFDLVAILIRMGDQNDGCYSPWGLVMEVPPFHDTLRNAKSSALRTTAVPQSCREPLL